MFVWKIDDHRLGLWLLLYGVYCCGIEIESRSFRQSVRITNRGLSSEKVFEIRVLFLCVPLPREMAPRVATFLVVLDYL